MQPPGEIVNSDVVGKLEPSFLDGYRYFATFMDGHFRYLFVAFMVNRSDLYDSLKAMSTMFQKLVGVPIKSLHSVSVFCQPDAHIQKLE